MKSDKERGNDVTARTPAQYPELDVSKELRLELEDLISKHVEFTNVLIDQKTDISLVRKLKQKGFRATHIEEALSYRNTLNGALEWLCIFVPEEDLPEGIKPTDMSRIDVQNYTQARLSHEYSVRRLISAGFDRKTVEESLLNLDGEEPVALTSLCCALIDHKLTPITGGENFCNLEEIQEETEVLRAIYEDLVFKENSDSFAFSIVRNISGESDATIELTIAKGLGYPMNPPAIVISDEKIPAYIRLNIMKSALQETVLYLGSPMLYSCFSWIEDNAEILFNSPPLLVSLKPKKITQVVANISASESEYKKVNIKRKIMNSETNETMLHRKHSMENTVIYKEMLSSRMKLPAFKSKDMICRTLQSHQVLLICGSTGSGKSTQSGQFILDEAIEQLNGAKCRIICTQPRRISATSLAERVSQERCEKIGDTVGYSIRGESKQSDNTRLLFCTTGVLLRMIQTDPNLSDFSHVIIDEVHERGGIPRLKYSGQ